jgi:hypothetical protein
MRDGCVSCAELVQNCFVSLFYYITGTRYQLRQPIADRPNGVPFWQNCVCPNPHRTGVLKANYFIVARQLSAVQKLLPTQLLERKGKPPWRLSLDYNTRRSPRM